MITETEEKIINVLTEIKDEINKVVQELIKIEEKI
jgi:hypothetical protein